MSTVFSEKKKNDIKYVNILGVNVGAVDVTQLHEHIRRYVVENEKVTIPHVNAHGLNYAYKLPWFKDFLNTSALVFCDGAGVMLGARVLGYTLPQRITYADWMWELGGFCQEQGFTLFFLGSQPAVAENAAIRLRQQFSKLQIDIHHGYFNKNRDHEENLAVLEKINLANPDILIVGLGMPLQEQWLVANRKYINASVVLTGGAVFDYISGNLQRAPLWMTNHNLEWLGRLVIEPKRLWKRYIIGNPLFLLRLIQQRLGI